MRGDFKNEKESKMSYDYYLDQCHEEWTNEQEENEHDEIYEDDYEPDDYDADEDDYEVCFDHESGSLEVVR